MNIPRLSSFALTVVLTGCAAEGPQYGHVVIMQMNEARNASGYPAPGTVWRLEERDLRALSPAPTVEPPPPPRLPPPPRPNDPPAPSRYYAPPYHGPYWGAPGFYY